MKTRYKFSKWATDTAITKTLNYSVADAKIGLKSVSGHNALVNAMRDFYTWHDINWDAFILDFETLKAEYHEKIG